MNDQQGNENQSDEDVLSPDAHSYELGLPVANKIAVVSPTPDLTLDDEFEVAKTLDGSDDFGGEMEDLSASRKPRQRYRLYCFSCNRPEGHFLSHENRWYYSFLIGMTFGLIRLVGPYQCQCCGHHRLMRSNHLNVRYLIKYMESSKTKKKSRSKRRKNKY